MPRGVEKRISVMREVLGLLLEGDASFNKLKSKVKAFGSHVILSKALKQLGHAGIVERTIEGTWKLSEWAEISGIAQAACHTSDFETPRRASPHEVVDMVEKEFLEMSMPLLVYSYNFASDAWDEYHTNNRPRDGNKRFEETWALVAEIAADSMAESFSHILNDLLKYPQHAKLYQELTERSDQLLRAPTRRHRKKPQLQRDETQSK